MEFTKMHGIGNDYIYVDTRKGRPKDPSLAARTLSDRHFGIGADGLILINPSDRADFEMEMYNADGSRGKMCGNGIRCVGKYVYDHGLTDRTTVTVETLSGVKTLELYKGEDGRIAGVRVDMGVPSLLPRDLPLDPERAAVLMPKDWSYDRDPVLNREAEIGGAAWNISCVSMGNPHCVLFLEQDVRDLNLPLIGPAFEKDPLFPEGVNTEFVNVLSEDRLRMRVWERGSGETLACGTGACAAACAAMKLGLCRTEVRMELLGGTLSISLLDGHLFMEGTATEVFSGHVEVPLQ